MTQKAVAAQPHSGKPLIVAAAALVAALLGGLTLVSRGWTIAVTLLVVLLWPPVGRFLLAALILAIPWLNPALFNFGDGRMYLSHTLVLCATFSGLVTLPKRRDAGRFLIVYAAALLYMVTVGLSRVGATETLAWTFKPLFPFLVTTATILLVPVERTGRWFRLLAYGGIVGCSLAIVYALAPQIDPFIYTRPSDIPFVSRIGPFVRAAGGFVYPNNLAMFAAYGAIMALSALILDFPKLSRWLSITLLVCASGALALSASRAAAGGVLLAVTLLISRANFGRRLAGVTIFGLLVGAAALFLMSSEGGELALEERIGTAGGSSLEFRREGWEYAIERIKESPFIGTGIEESRLDSSWHLYLYTGGIVGVVFLAILVMAVWVPGLRRTSDGRYLAGALLIAMGSTAFLQDSLGQSLAVWYPAVMFGLITSALLADEVKTARSETQLPGEILTSQSI